MLYQRMRCESGSAGGKKWARYRYFVGQYSR